ncbi:MAG: hypothetical protein JWL76_2290 [Thermoleophilia bacterium]|nr:hypothetical protein [Thermoleophilia bacterium]
MLRHRAAFVFAGTRTGHTGGMSSKRTWFTAAVALITLGLVSFVLQPVLDPKPDTKCVADDQPSSGFQDDEKDCNVSIASYEKISDWESKPKPFRIIGLLLVVGGIVTGAIGLVRTRRGDDPPRAG